MAPGDRVRYAREFLAGNENRSLAASFEHLEGVILAIEGTTAQVNFGSHFRATSVVEIAWLEKIED